MRRGIGWVVACMMLGFAAASEAAEQIDALYFESSPSSWVGQGETIDISGQPGTISHFRYFTQGAFTNALQFLANGGEWELMLVGNGYTVPQVGFYGDATRWPFMGDGAGLDLSGQGRGNNTLSGFFEVFEAEYDTNGTLISFAADFTQYDEKDPDAWNVGSIRYNSSIPIPFPEPTAVSLLGITGGAALLRRHRRAV